MENLAPGMKQRFKEQLTELATKYTLLESHSEQDINIMIDILKRLEQGESEYLDIDRALEVLELIGKHYVEAIEYYLWWRENIDKQISIEQAKKDVEYIEREGFIMINEHLVYKNDGNKNLKRTLLENYLDESYDVERLFDKDELVEMWMNNTSKEDAISNMMSLGMEEILDGEPEEVYISCSGDSIKYFKQE